MSRWITNFENHNFKKIWDNLKNSLEQSKANENIPTEVQELARLKKVVAYLDSSMNNIDPELFPANLLTSCEQQTNNCLSHVNNFNSNKNIGHITNANNHVDNLLTYIRPYMITDGAMKKTLLASVRAYNKEMEKSLSSFNDTVKEELDEIEKL